MQPSLMMFRVLRNLLYLLHIPVTNKRLPSCRICNSAVASISIYNAIKNNEYIEQDK